MRTYATPEEAHAAASQWRPEWGPKLWYLGDRCIWCGTRRGYHAVVYGHPYTGALNLPELLDISLGSPAPHEFLDR